MKPENLEKLLYFYIEEKIGYDDIDSPVEKKCAPGGYDEPLPLEQNLYQDGANWEAQASVSHNPVILQYDGANWEAQASVSHNPVILQYAPLTGLQRARAVDAGRKLVDMSAEFSSSQPNKSGVKFKSSCMFVTPEPQTVNIPIIRSPDSDIPLKILWKTRDRTAQSGIHYIDSGGEITLDKAATQAMIPIEILSSATSSSDLRFQVDLSVENCAYVPQPMTVNIQNMNNLYEDERSVIQNLFQSSASAVSEVMFFLDSKLTLRTFHSGLSYMCSKADSLPLEIGLAFELTTASLKFLPYPQVFKVLSDFFRRDEYDF